LPDNVGKKVVGLLQLKRLRLRVPRTWVVSYEGYRRYLANDEAVVAQLRRELGAALDPTLAYAVRSSANIEDGAHRTFAGQFRTVLDACGVDNVMRAIWSVWATAHSEAVTSYLEHTGHPVEGLEMAVIVQEMVDSRAAGVAFSRNPVTGRDEVVVEAVRGKGTALVQDGVTPLHWANRSGCWTQVPDPGAVQSLDGLMEAVTDVAEQTRTIARRLAADVDLEWAWDGRGVHWLQVRRAAPAQQTHIWSNAISKEMLPGMTKPLVWSVNVPQTNGAWVGLISEVIGKNDIDPVSLARQFHYRTYFDTGAFGRIFESMGMPPDSLDRMVGVTTKAEKRRRSMPMMGMMRHLPRLVRFGVRLWTLHRRAEGTLFATEQHYGGLPVQPSDDLDGPAVLHGLDALFQVHCGLIYYNIVVPLLLRAYEALLRKGLARAGIDSGTVDLVGGIEGIERYDLPGRIMKLNAAFRELDDAMQQRIRESTYADFRNLEGIADYQGAIDALLAEFGHLSDSATDFSNVTWRERPEMVLRMVADYPVLASAQANRVRFDMLPLRGLRRAWLAFIYRRTQRFRFLRDAISAAYTQGMGLIRARFLALGDRLVAGGALQERDDVFYLYETEVRRWYAGEWAGEDLASLVDRRKREMENSRDAQLPSVIYGDDPPPFIPQSQLGQLLQGTPTSPGYYTGPAKLVRGMAEFGKLAAGDVLVIPYSDVAWTPLFARAGAVVAESGGMLSHSSIIAREYGLPAVVSVEGALTLPESATVTVNGYTGEVILHQEVP
jgi:pyruvate,water dikinase